MSERREFDGMIDIAVASADQMAYIVDGAAAEGWNPGRDDAAAFRAADPDGFLVATIDGAAVGCISRVRYGTGFGFIGLYIVRAELRGRGIGTALWERAMGDLGERVVGLDGVVTMQDAYRRSGFVLAHRNVRYAGTVPPGLSVPPHVEPITADDVDEVAAYDTACFGADRSSFLHAWLAVPGVMSMAVRRDGRLVGYAVTRWCREGAKFGPLFADDPEVAQELLSAGLAGLPAGTTFALDVPEVNEAAVQLARAAGMSPVFETARMYAGGAWPLPLSRIFGITTFELG